jgi:hypothetical protein
MGMMSEHPGVGPRLRAANLPQRFQFDDLRLIMNVRAGRPEEQVNLAWEWSDEIDWSPRVQMTMSSWTANRYFQGRENIAYAIIRRRINTWGDIRSAIELVPITRPIYQRYRELVAAEYPHLELRESPGAKAPSTETHEYARAEACRARQSVAPTRRQRRRP